MPARSDAPSEDGDFLTVGSGIAGLRAALEPEGAGPVGG
jgi:succinate dehydrogenase/fumarate reductase flavoprotein subunit